MALGVQQDVLRLQVAVADASLVEILQTQRHLCSEKLGLRLQEAPLPPDVRQQLPATEEVRDEVEPRRGLKRIPESRNEGVVGRPQHPALRDDVLGALPRVRHTALLEDLHREQPPTLVSPLSDEVHASEGAVPYALEELEVCLVDGLGSLRRSDLRRRGGRRGVAPRSGFAGLLHPARRPCRPPARVTDFFVGPSIGGGLGRGRHVRKTLLLFPTCCLSQ
mmetsp:Transcript_118100/g.345931  ORF Transcript_118100/g.345931 Transcript_118100/m.345931 type:complete len:221 (+) Transcript_118100:634-1296(+)